MNAVNSLLHDHERFRLLLDAMDAAIELDADTRFVVRELCFTLGERLRDHMRRERELMASCHEPLSARELAALADGHDDEAHSLAQALVPLTDATPTQGLTEADGLLELAIAQFRYHMDAQEYKLFPALTWSMKEDGWDHPVNRMSRWEPAWKQARRVRGSPRVNKEVRHGESQHRAAHAWRHPVEHRRDRDHQDRHGANSI